MTKKDKDNDIRRFSRRDQKNRLQKPKSLFPDEDDFKLPPDEEKVRDDSRFMPPDFDIRDFDLPDTDADALELLSSLKDEVRSPNITPPEERYPPTAPSAKSDVRKPTPIQKATVTQVSQKQSNNFFYNMMTFIVFIMIFAFIYWFIQIWNNPQSALNPFPPNTPFIVVTASPGSNLITDLNATPDEQGQIFVVITDTPMPTVINDESLFPFVHEEILYAPNSNQLGCNWWSIAGTVTDMNGNPINGYRVRVIGEDLNEVVFSGASQAFGEGGYELPLVGTPQQAQFTVQLFSPEDIALSDEIDVITQDSCDANVAIINFVQNR